jgi:FkbM family methyltransferase
MSDFLTQDRAKLLRVQDLLDSGHQLRIDVGLSFAMPHTIAWTRYNQKTIVLGFEPHPDNFLRCEEILETLPPSIRSRIFLFNLAISEDQGVRKQKLYVPNFDKNAPDPGTSSLLMPKRDKISSLKEIQVSCCSLHTILSQITFSRISIIKTDTQGMDLVVLRSLGKFLEIVQSIKSERDSTAYYEHANSGQDLDKFLQSRGFKLARNFYSRADESIISDSMYVKKCEGFRNNLPYPLYLHLIKFPIFTLVCLIANPIGAIFRITPAIMQLVSRFWYWFKHRK